MIAVICVILTALSCGGPVAPTPIPPPPGPDPTPAPNTPPRIVNLSVSSNRAEVGEEVTLTANVLDEETLADDLQYEWQTVAGSIVGTGRVVTWRAPADAPMPATYTITLIVVDRYNFGGQTLEHRTTAETSQIHVDDSPKTVRRLSEEFLRDFATYSMSPEMCVRNFSDSCPGKRRELNEIIDNRRRFEIRSHTFEVSRVRVDTSRTSATVSGRCEFVSRLKADDSIRVARGFCVLDLVNENYRWWLCNSSASATDPESLNFFSSAFSSEN